MSSFLNYRFSYITALTLDLSFFYISSLFVLFLLLLTNFKVCYFSFDYISIGCCLSQVNDSGTVLSTLPTFSMGASLDMAWRSLYHYFLWNHYYCSSIIVCTTSARYVDFQSIVWHLPYSPSSSSPRPGNFWVNIRPLHPCHPGLASVTLVNSTKA